ncbi:MAG: ABC transporter permease subunit [Dehalobacterium sp.]
MKQYSIFDIMGTAAAMLMASIPGFWFGLMAILLFALKLGWLPSNGSDTWLHYILPSITLAIPVAASLLRLTRTTMLETVRQDYIRTARAKGQSERKGNFPPCIKKCLAAGDYRIGIGIWRPAGRGCDDLKPFSPLTA